MKAALQTPYMYFYINNARTTDCRYQTRPTRTSGQSRSGIAYCALRPGLADSRVEVIVLCLAVHKRNLPQHARVFSRHTFR